MIIMKKFLFPVFLAAVMASGCNQGLKSLRNKIRWLRKLRSTPTRTEYGIYTTKVGRQLTIAPTYRYVENAVYSWRLQTTGRIISTEPTLEYTFASVNETDEAGYYLTLEVTNRNGTSTEELLVQVLELTPPTIRIDEQVEVVRKHEYEFTPDVQAKDISEFEWTLRAAGRSRGPYRGNGTDVRILCRGVGPLRIDALDEKRGRFGPENSRYRGRKRPCDFGNGRTHR